MRALPASIAGIALCLAAAQASAFCRTRTCQMKKNAYCPQDELTGCYTEGAEVYWGDSCLSFAVQRDGSIKSGITAEQVVQLVDEGFRAWSSVSCPRGGTPPLTALPQGVIACNAVEFNCEVLEDNSNLIVFRDDFVDRLEFRDSVIALTILTGNTKTGELFDADIEINSRDEEFVIGRPPPGSLARDLQGVINHELGHLLGLSHPKNVPGALMSFNYQGTLLPAEDDIAGICDARGAAANDPECSVVELAPDAGCLGADTTCRPEASTQIQSDDGCACRVASSSAAAGKRGRAAWLLWGAFACWLSRRRLRSAVL